MTKYYIYILLKSGVAFYIGLSENTERRFNEHKKTFGEDITIEIKEEYTGSLSTAYTLEELWTKKYSDLGIQLKNKNSDITLKLQCKECGLLLEQTPGKRKREFCDSTCRSNFWQKLKRKTKLMVMPKDSKPKLALLMPLNKGKDLEPPKIEWTPTAAPKTLSELKTMCPPELTGFDKSEWISKERQKYGI